MKSDRFSFNSKDKEYPIHYNWAGLTDMTVVEAKKILNSLNKALQKADDAKRLACKGCGHNLSHMKVKGLLTEAVAFGETFDIKCPKCKLVHAFKVKL